MSIEIVAIIIIASVVGIWIFKRRDPNRGAIQKDNPGNNGKGAENSRLNQRDSESHGDQIQSKNSKHSPTLKTFDELGQYWLGQEYDDTRGSHQTPRTLPTSYQRPQGSPKHGNINWSFPTQKRKSSIPWEYDSQRDSGSAFYPLDPARYVLGESNNPNYRSKRYARTRVVFRK